MSTITAANIFKPIIITIYNISYAFHEFSVSIPQDSYLNYCGLVSKSIKYQIFQRILIIVKIIKNAQVLTILFIPDFYTCDITLLFFLIRAMKIRKLNVINISCNINTPNILIYYICTILQFRSGHQHHHQIEKVLQAQNSRVEPI